MPIQTNSTNLKESSKPYPYPSCWQNDDRVHVLLAPFRNRGVNPENYDSKMKFWQDTIREYCKFKGKVYFHKQELQINFTKGQRVPSCLDTVLDEMQRQNIVRLRNDYEYDPENSWSGWAINSFLKKPLSWGFDKIKVKLGARDVTQLGLVQFIHLEVIRKFCTDLQDILFRPPYLGSLHHYDVLQKDVFTIINMTEECLRLCLHTLYVQRKIGLEYKPNTSQLQIHLVKIPSKEDNDITITETDHAIHNLHVTKSNLIKQIEDLEVEIKENENKAHVYVKEKNRLLAKTYLRKKHLLEKNHERHSLALHNIETLLSNVHEAKLNGVILDAYKFGSKALQNALNAANLKYDNVDEIVSDVRDTMDSYREIQDNLANANFNDSLDSLADDLELEQELKEILGETSTTNTPTKNVVGNNTNVSMPKKIEITDGELLDMLNELEINQNSPGKSFSSSVLKS